MIYLIYTIRAMQTIQKTSFLCLMALLIAGLPGLLAIAQTTAGVEAGFASASARMSEAGVLIEWQSEVTDENLGFNLYRLQNGQRYKINQEVVPGGAFYPQLHRVRRGARSFAFLDRQGEASAVYQLEAINTDGLVAVATTVRVDSGSTGPLPRLSKPRFHLADSGRPGEMGQNAYSPTDRSPHSSGPIEDQWVVAAQTGLRIAVNHDGWYRLTQQQMESAGFNPVVDVRNLRLFGDGREVALSVSRSHGSFVSGDYIEFYGRGIDTATTRDRVYYLIADSQPGKRVSGELHITRPALNPVTFPFEKILQLGSTPWFPVVYRFIKGIPFSIDRPAKTVEAKAKATPDEREKRKRPSLKRRKQQFGHASSSSARSFNFTVERKDRTVYFVAALNGDKENFFGAVISANPVTQTIVAPNPEPTADGPARLEVVLQGVGQLQHQVDVSFNDVPLGSMSFFGLANQLRVFEIPLALVQNGNNTIKFTSTIGGTVSVVDYVRLTYPRALTADNNSLRLNLRPTQTVTVDGFTTPAIQLLDLSDPFAVQVSSPISNPSGSGYAIEIAGSQVAAKSRLLLALPMGQFETPASLSLNQPSNLHSSSNGADFLVIGHSSLLPTAAPLVTLRQSEGMTVAVIDIEDIYDEFDFGTHGPQALRNFFSHAYSNWSTKPRFAVLLGDASLDPKNYQGGGNIDLVPTKLIDATYNETASDEWLADLNDDGIGEISLGRLPVRNVAEAQLEISKIVSFLPSSVPQSALLVADDPTGYYFNFEQANDEVQALLPAAMTVQRVNRRTDPSAREAVIRMFNSGQALVNYTGHGNVDTWTGASIFTSTDAARLRNAVSVVISQVYGGGGEAGATLRNDFVELFNRGRWPVRLGGWSLQYSTAAGSSWQVSNLPDVTVQPGHYFLVQLAQGPGGTTNLPAADASGTINLDAVAGKVALVNGTAALSGSGCPFNSTVADMLGYGGASCAEGTPAPVLNETTSALRGLSGCADTETNSVDFFAGPPVPRNTAVAENLCINTLNRLPFSFVVVMDCLNGYFQDPILQGLGEALMKAPNGGTVAAFASSGLTIPNGQHAMATQLYLLLYGSQSLALGDAVKTAKAATSDIDVRRTWILFGDPSMKIR